MRKARRNNTPLRAPWCAFGVILAQLPFTVPAAVADPDPQEGNRFFREKIEPVLEAQCYSCHSAKAEKVKAKLYLDSRAGMLRGGETGPAVVPGDIGESLLIQAIRHEDGLEMPAKKPKLPDQTIADFETWVKIGAPDPRSSDALTAVSPQSAEMRRHWSFQPVKKTVPPQVRDASWARTAIDAFILSKLEERNWQPAPEASRAEWIRRVTFDLIGLPPLPEEIEAFTQDQAADAFERVVDRLLDSPHYGERWAQHWLDVVRFAESEGYEYDRHIPDAWRFRDFVIDSLNSDKAFDRFLIEQIAGDEIAPDDPECQTASIFHRLGPVRRNAGNPEIALSRNEVLTERTDIIGTAFLGLSVGCARCHNHKLEPISQQDYYRLEAYMAATDEHNISLAPAQDVAAWEAKSREVKEQVKKLQKEARKASGAEKLRLEAEIEAIEDELPPAPSTIPSTWNNFKERTTIHVLRRGIWENKGEAVGPRPLSVLVPDDQPELSADVSDPRTRLARWLTAKEHPLTSRVLVNRIWQQHLGAGLVKTVNDFGTKGDRPSHPELLDWLAAALVEHGWRLKPIHRLIVLSSTYRQSSRSELAAVASESDPENRHLWRFNRRRLTAEEIRDAMLAVSGRLNLEAGGPSVMVRVAPELVRQLYKPAQWKVPENAAELDRRSVYLFAKRNLRLPFMETFDAPTLLSSCARRESSTHAPQALEMLNGALANDLAQAFARRLETECGDDSSRIVQRAFLLALGREPLPEERIASLAFVRDQPLNEFALAMFNLNGFLYVP
ncbi:MAG TPA: PSD1 and planctomycete cytochrome C domain-containing protein [Isosphaeraceae bacterium]|nr:PSD1 and planctomycete cytochrome C domain-containing protein [Isosphaeraceae bacterium]